MDILNPLTKLHHTFKETEKKVRHLTQIRWLRFSVQILIISFCLIFLASNLSDAKSLLSHTQPNYIFLVIAWLLTTIAVFLGALSWWLTLKGLDHRVSLIQSVRVHVFSNLAKYLPGYAWQIFGKVYLSKKMDLSTPVIGLGMTLEIIQLVGVGLALAISSFPKHLLNNWINIPEISENMILVGAVLFTILLAFPFLLRAILKRLPSNYTPKHFSPLFLIGSSFVIFIGWLLFGISFWLLAAGLQPMQPSTLPIYIFTLTASFLAGLIIIFIPGGFGVRESVMVLILSPNYIPAPLAVLIALLSRIMVTLSEIFSAFLTVAIFLVLNKTRTKKGGILLRG